MKQILETVIQEDSSNENVDNLVEHLRFIVIEKWLTLQEQLQMQTQQEAKTSTKKGKILRKY